MRCYPVNSPEAAARIVALALIADGHVCRSELEVLHRLDAQRELGLEPDGLASVVQSLCEDLLLDAYAGGALMARVDDKALALLMAEISEPALQRKVLSLSLAVVRADDHLADGEALVLAAARRHWPLGAEAPVQGRAARAASGMLKRGAQPRAAAMICSTRG